MIDTDNGSNLRTFKKRPSYLKERYFGNVKQSELESTFK